MSHWDEFDYVVVNDDLDKAVADLESVLAGQGAQLATDNVVLRGAVAEIVGL
jgi:guanylate kinase